MRDTPQAHFQRTLSPMHEVMPVTVMPEGNLATVQEPLQQIAWIREWLRFLEITRANPSTIKLYTRSTKLWVEFLRDQQTADPTPLHVHLWASSLAQRGLSTASISSMTAALKSFYRWTESRGFYQDIARSLKLPSGQRRTPLPCPTREQIKDMVRATSANRISGILERAIIHVLYSTGLRCVSVERATIGDVDMQNGILRHQPKGHSDKDAVAVLSKSARQALMEYLNTRPGAQEHEPLFVRTLGKAHGKALTSRWISHVIFRLSEALGLVHRSPKTGKVIGRGHFSAHSIRRASITRIYDTFGVHAAQTFAGHASAETTTQSYARVKAHEMLTQMSETMDL
jgi:site-specific recombinase XerD